MQLVNKGSIHPLLGGSVLVDGGPAMKTAYLLEHDAGGVYTVVSGTTSLAKF